MIAFCCDEDTAEINMPKLMPQTPAGKDDRLVFEVVFEFKLSLFELTLHQSQCDHEQQGSVLRDTEHFEHEDQHDHRLNEHHHEFHNEVGKEDVDGLHTADDRSLQNALHSFLHER